MSRKIQDFPPSLRRAIEKQLAKEAPSVPAPVSPVKRDRAKRCHWFGNIKCDSQTEADIAASLAASNPAVLVHGCLRLADDCHIQPDYVIIQEVFPDGSFRGVLADAKAQWKGKESAHVEDDWRVKQKWVREQYGLEIQVITKGDTDNAIR
jgi:hypothetical protein